MSGATSGLFGIGGPSFSSANLSGAAAGIGGVFSDLGQAASSQMTAAGETAASAGFGQAAGFAFNNYQQTEAAGKLQLLQEQRSLYQVGGQQQAQAGAQGIKMEGSAANIMRNSAQQGAVAQQLTSSQTNINAAAFLAQMQADNQEMVQANAEATAAKSASGMADLGAVFSAGKAAISIAGMF